MITLSTERLKLDDYQHILFDNDSIILSDETLNLVEQSFLFLKEFSNNKVIYGVNTGLGPMAQYRVDTEDQINLQYNLIRSHAAGSGKPLPPDYVRSAMISRLKSLSLGYSGVHADAIKLLADLIN
ncbi:MAG: aromatic amino acid lyase, partial [Bacteroidetes bacterium]